MKDIYIVHVDGYIGAYYKGQRMVLDRKIQKYFTQTR